MRVERVALIFDNETRPETTGTYCLRALQQLVRVEHFLPKHRDAIPRHGFDLYINVDDGLRYQLPVSLHPCAFWAIDTHLDFAWSLHKANDFDFVFAAQKDGATRLCDEGISTSWLPLACDPEVHCKHDDPKRHDVCFVGNLAPGPRADLLRLIQEKYPDAFVGQRYFEEMAKTYSAARVVFNRSVRNDVNMRVFEAVACGSLLLTNDLRDNGQEELLQDGKHLATYTGAEGLLDRLAFYLTHEEVRERIAAAGRAEVLAKHTYGHRMARLLEEVGQGIAGTPVAVWGGFGPPAGCDEPLVVEAPPMPEANDPACAASSGNGVGVDPGYYEFARPEILALVPATARTVLEIGCGAGRLGEAIKARQGAAVVGVELAEAAAHAARQRLDQVFIGDIEALELPFGPRSFDAIVCGDVLEHLADPERLLGRACAWLKPSGALIASIPNVRHHTVVRSLLEGNWTYESAGLLDRTHVRFFTRRELERLFRDTGFTITRCDVVPGSGYEQWCDQGRPGQVTVGQLNVRHAGAGEAEEFFVYQYLIVAEPRSRTEASDLVTPPDAPKAVAAVPAQPNSGRPLRFMFLGDFSTSWRHETYTAGALEQLGHAVTRFHEYQVPSVDQAVAELNSGHYDCLLFYKGRLGAHRPAEVFTPTGEEIAEVIRRATVPCYTWYVDRAHDFEPSRAAWMRRVAPLCRVAFVAETVLTRTPWARWHLLREPVNSADVQPIMVPEAQRQDVAFLGQLYGVRDDELAPVREAFPLNLIAGVYGAALSGVVRAHKVILGPRYPCVPGYWGNRLYVVLGHGGFFLAPEVDGMHEEGFLPGTHYAALGAHPVEDVRYWLARPEERERIAQAGQRLVLSRFTYAHAAREVCRVIEETLHA
jgi:2-polyprenyl-3-methyl-5-hydroxy-6-metoxy-1,4-benzoquinol methylase